MSGSATILRDAPPVAPVAAPTQGGAATGVRAPPPDDGVPRPYGTIFAFLLPALTLYAAFTAYPFFRTLWNSFHKVLPRRSEFVGLENYATLANDEFFWRAVRNTLIWASTSPLFEVTIALLLALALYAKVPGARASSGSPGSRRC